MLSIDFGTSRVKVAYVSNSQVHLARIGRGELPYIPSLFYIGKDGQVLVGEDAADMLDVDPKGVVSTLKRKIRQPYIRKNRQRKTPQDLLTHLFVSIRNQCTVELPHVFTEPPLDVSLTYPARFTEIELKILEAAALDAGFQKVSLINEPESAAITWQHRGGKELDSKTVVILDCGGGTADWACLTKINKQLKLHSEIPEDGDQNLGGHDIEEALLTTIREHLEDTGDHNTLQFIDDNLPKVLDQFRQVKERISSGKGASTKRQIKLAERVVSISEEVLANLINIHMLKNLVTRFNGYLDTVRRTTGDRNPKVLLVGGTGKLLGLKDAISQQCGVEVIWWMESEFATVQGALYLHQAFLTGNRRTSNQPTHIHHQESHSQARPIPQDTYVKDFSGWNDEVVETLPRPEIGQQSPQNPHPPQQLPPQDNPSSFDERHALAIEQIKQHNFHAPTTSTRTADLQTEDVDQSNNRRFEEDTPLRIRSVTRYELFDLMVTPIKEGGLGMHKPKNFIYAAITIVLNFFYVIFGIDSIDHTWDNRLFQALAFIPWYFWLYYSLYMRPYNLVRKMYESHVNLLSNSNFDPIFPNQNSDQESVQIELFFTAFNNAFKHIRFDISSFPSFILRKYWKRWFFVGLPISIFVIVPTLLVLERILRRGF